MSALSKGGMSRSEAMSSAKTKPRDSGAKTVETAGKGLARSSMIAWASATESMMVFSAKRDGRILAGKQVFGLGRSERIQNEKAHGKPVGWRGFSISISSS